MNAFRRDAGIKQNRIGASLKFSQVASTQPQLSTGTSHQKHPGLQTVFKLVRTDTGKRRLANFFSNSKRRHALRCRRHNQIVTTQQARIIDLPIYGICRLDREHAVVVNIQRLNASILGGYVVTQQKVFPRRQHRSVHTAGFVRNLRHRHATERIQVQRINQCLVPWDHQL